jgi:hypothetical protein
MPTQDWTVNQGPLLMSMRPEVRRGVCAAMSYDWIRVVSSGMDYSPNLYGGISQHVLSMQRGGDAYISSGKSWTDQFSTTGLRDGFAAVTWQQYANNPGDLLQFSYSERVQVQIDVYKADFVHLSFYGGGGGHAVALKVDAAPFLFFDPNSGQYSDNSWSSLAAALNQYIPQYYPNLLLSGWTGGFRGAAKAAYARPK